MQDPKPEITFKQAQALIRAGRKGEAGLILRRLAEPQNLSSHALNMLGSALFDAEDFAASEGCLRRSLQIDPNQVGVAVLLGRVLTKLGRAEDALSSFDAAITLRPGHAPAHFMRAQALRRQGRLGEALSSYNRAIELDDQPTSHAAKAVLLSEMGDLPAALASCDRANELQPDHAPSRFAKAEILLMAGDYPAAWEQFESRWAGPWRKEHPLLANVPLWSGSQPVVGRSLLVHPEVGLGDFIMYARYLPMVQERGAKLIVVAPPPLVPLLRSLPNPPQVVPVREPAPMPDLHCPIMSLPRAFGTTLDTVPAKVPYLATAEPTRHAWRARLGPRTAMPRVGLVWQGRTRREIDGVLHKSRSIPLAELAALWEYPAEFHSLQKVVPDGDAALLATLPVRDHREELTDFAETAALAQEMDLIISIDTSVAHLAGALGKPLWMMLPYTSDFRWPMNSRQSPWYPTATLFRQVHPGRWTEVVQSVAGALRAFVDERGRA